MDAHKVFQYFNPCKFIVYCCLASFAGLVALKKDGRLTCSYWVVFSPIWVWKLLVVVGAAVGISVWFRHPQYRLEGESYVHFKAMLISLSVHLLLLMFEILVCDQLSSNSPRHMWMLVFVPLIFISILSIVVCVWSVKHDRSCEMELVCSVNILQFVFLPLKLDGFVRWSWEVVFVPLWVVMCLCVVGLLYALIFAAILLRADNASGEQRRSSAHTALGYGFLVLPLLAFLVLLANKLDGVSDMSYLMTVSPLFISFFTLLVLSFNSKLNNIWWFGLRRDFCTLLLDSCPCLREYCNVSYQARAGSTSSTASSSESSAAPPSALQLRRKERPVVPAAVIDVPD